jgi:hypothetical protein
LITGFENIVLFGEEGSERFLFWVLRGLGGLCHVVVAERVFIVLLFGFLLQGFHEIRVGNA